MESPRPNSTASFGSTMLNHGNAYSVPNTPSRMELLFAAGELLSPNLARSNCDGGDMVAEVPTQTTGTTLGTNSKLFLPEDNATAPLSAVSQTELMSLPQKKKGRKLPLLPEGEAPKKRGRPRKQPVPKKRRPGRPRKHPLPKKRGPGRPRKRPLPTELPVYGPANRVGRPIKLPTLSSEFVIPEQEEKKKSVVVAELEQKVVHQVTRKGRAQKVPLHLNDCIHTIGRKPKNNWMRRSSDSDQEETDESTSSGGFVRTKGNDVSRSLKGRKTEDGCFLPRRPPKERNDGTFIRPAGRAPPGTVWDAVRGVWAPFTTLKGNDGTIIPQKTREPCSESDSIQERQP